MLRVGCDIGGTFTDLILQDGDGGAVRQAKLLTTPDDPSRAVAEGLAMLAAERPGLMRDLAMLIHGTTLVINAVIERKGVSTGLIATAGFRDILEARREIRYDIYDLRQRFPVPLVERRLRREVPERVLADGTVATPLDEAAAAEVLRGLAADGVVSVAVCLLHAYANPDHERRLAAIAADVAPGLDLSLSSDILPEIREFERTATTAVNAYVRPLFARYVARLEERLREGGAAAPLHLMLSGGGLVGAAAAARAPVRLAESGPVGGAVAAAALGAEAGRDSVLAFDMGGTTAKACLIEGGRLPVTTAYEVDRVHRFKRGSGTPIAVPTVDLIEIGAGGGSIAALDALGHIRVGPESAGADPGPICYGRGGTQPTVTDCNLLLGNLDPDRFLGGRMRLHADAARAGVMRAIGEPLGLDAEAAAAAVIAVVDEAMAGAARMYAAERGGDLMAATMVAFGGAGPLHADGVARRLGLREILVPPSAGVFSALGFLAAPVSFEAARTRLSALDPGEASAVETAFGALETEARGVVGEASPGGAMAVQRMADMCFAGQGHTLRIDLSEGPFDPAEADRRFRAAYAAAYGYAYDDMAAQIVTLRVEASLALAPAAVARPPVGDGAANGIRDAWDPSRRAFVPHALADLGALAAGARVAGPAIIAADGATIRIGAGAVARMQPGGWLTIALPGERP